jgi:hypothetical protein
MYWSANMVWIYQTHATQAHELSSLVKHTPLPWNLDLFTFPTVIFDFFRWIPTSDGTSNISLLSCKLAKRYIIFTRNNGYRYVILVIQMSWHLRSHVRVLISTFIYGKIVKLHLYHRGFIYPHKNTFVLINHIK